jgi:hypothetical protein
MEKLQKNLGRVVMLRNRLFALAAVLAASTLISAQTRADVITFVDLTDTITVGHVGTDTTISNVGTCDETGCIISIARGTQTFGATTGQFLLAEDPSLHLVSDFIDVLTQEILFVSLADGITETCASFAAGVCKAQETGVAQLADTITWSGGGSTDQIFIQSDAEPVPEPGSLLLLTAALGMLGLGKRFKL